MGRGCIVTRETKDGGKRYVSVISIKGRQQWRTWTRRKDAEEYLDRMSPEIRDGSYREIKKATFGEYVKHWQDSILTEPEKFKPSTRNGYRSVIAHHLLPYFKHWPMQAIDAAAINA